MVRAARARTGAISRRGWKEQGGQATETGHEEPERLVAYLRQVARSPTATADRYGIERPTASSPAVSADPPGIRPADTAPGSGSGKAEALGQFGECPAERQRDVRVREVVAARRAEVDDGDGLAVLRGAPHEPQSRQDGQRRAEHEQ